MKLLKAIIVCSVLAVPFVASAAETGTTRTLPGLGDADLDGRLTRADVLALGEYLFAGRSLPMPAEWYMDFNQDGRVSIQDVGDIARVVAGFASNMPAVPQTIIVGDVDGDGQVTPTDGETLINVTFRGGQLPPHANPAAGDINEDGTVNILDILDFYKQLHGVKI